MIFVLNFDVEILEDDLCDGIEVMNVVVNKYLEYELDRMIVVLWMKRRIEFEVVFLIFISRMLCNEEDFEDEDVELDDEFI